MKLKQVIFLANVLLFIGCAAASSQLEDLKLVIPDKAYDVRTDKLEHPAVTQTTFKVNVKYPTVALSDTQVGNLKQRGWTECLGHRSEWESYRDLSTEPNRYIYQRERSFFKREQLLAITMMYVSDGRMSLSSTREPDNEVQRVVVIHYDLSVPEVKAQMGKFIEACQPRT